MDKDTASHDFEEAVLEELAYIYERSALAQPTSGSSAHAVVQENPFEQAPPTAKDRFDKLRAEGARSSRSIAFDEELPPLNGLSLSGGGIRSASFSLGAVEALSELGALHQFQYVSSVSGGGYAASWLAAWCYREPDGVVGVQRALSEAATSASPPAQVRHLSRYVTYLAPRAGALSPDLWSLISAYLRNLFHTLCTTLPSILCFVAFPLLAAMWAAALRGNNSAIVYSFGACLAALAISALSVRALSESRRAHTAARNVVVAKLLSFLGPMLGGIAVAMFAGVFEWRKWPMIFDVQVYQPWMVAALTPLCIGVLLPWLSFAYRLGAEAQGTSFRERFEESVNRLWSEFWTGVRQCGASALAVIVAAASLLVFAFILQPVASRLSRSTALPDLLPVLAVTFGPLAWCAATMIGEFVVQRVINRYLDDGDREWIARFTGLSLTYAVMWSLLCLVALLAPTISYATHVGWVVLVLAAVVVGSRYFLAKFMLSIAVALAIAAIMYTIGLVLMLPFAASLLEMKRDAARVMHFAWVGTAVWVGVALVAWALVQLANVNRFSMHALYRDRLVRTFLGASRDKDRPPGDRGIPEGQEKQFEKRDAAPFHDFDPNDNPQLWWLRSVPEWRPNHWMPVFIINAALNRTWQSFEPGRVSKAHSFSFTPFSSGSTHTNYCRTSDYVAQEGGLSLGTAMAASGAALSSRSGRYDSPMLSFFLTLVNLRLGTWLGNPGNHETRGKAGPTSSALTLIAELLGGRGNASADWVHLSDGGHFENLGTYELLRRGCSKIIAIDSSADPDRTFEDLANLIRVARDELNISIERHTEVNIGPRDKAGGNYAAIFSITYPEGVGRLLYIKPCYYTSTTSTVPMEIQSYAKKEPNFPHEPTVDQFFSAEQFDAYRRLGHHQIKTIFAGAKAGSALRDFFERADVYIQAKKEPPKYRLAAELDLDGV